MGGALLQCLYTIYAVANLCICLWDSGFGWRRVYQSRPPGLGGVAGVGGGVPLAYVSAYDARG